MTAARICFVTGSWPPAVCGVGDSTANLCAHLAESADVDITVITSRGYGGGLPPRDNLRVRDVVERWTWRELPRIVRAVRAAAPDVVSIQYPTREYGRNPAMNFLPVILRLLGIRVLITLHEYSFHLSYKGRLRLAPSVLAAHHVLVTDPRYETDLRRVYRRKAISLIPIPSNIPASTLDDAARARRRRDVAGDGCLLLGYFGFITRTKIVLPLLHALKRLNEVHGVPARLLLIGDLFEARASNPLATEALRAIDALGLRPACIVTGHLPGREVADALAILDFAVLLYDGGLSPRNTTFHSAAAQGIRIVTNAVDYRPEYPGALVIEGATVEVEEICRAILEGRGRPAPGAAGDAFEDGWRRAAHVHLGLLTGVAARTGRPPAVTPPGSRGSGA